LSYIFKEPETLRHDGLKFRVIRFILSVF